MSTLLEQSDALHERVQSFVLAPTKTSDEFARLALDIAEYQARAIPAYGRLVQAHGGRLDAVAGIPAVPVEAFRLARVAAHAAELDTARFLTSGTTSGARGQHCMRRTDSYRLGAIAWARHALLPAHAESATVLCLAPEPEPGQSSSLGFMMQAFLAEFDPEGLAESRSRWFLSEFGLDLDGFRRAVDRGLQKPRPLLILATSFALVYLLDALDGRAMPTDGRAIVMQTGGFKGKVKEVAPELLRRALARTFGIDEGCVVGEYGMTELSSQLYEGTLPGASLCSSVGWYLPPPWLRVDAVDPVTHLPVSDGESGLACFIDLANVDSAVRILTEDRIVRCAGAIQLLGRATAAMPRGCSLAAEELIRAT